MTAPLWDSRAADAATGGRSSAPWQAGGVTIDSRMVAAGDLFVAIRGPHRDGHAFVVDALAAGAAAALVSHDVAGVPPDAALCRVADTQAGLEALGRAARTRTNARVVAVTGSVGKTGTKEALRICLGVCGPTHASAASYNNLWGVPLSLARMPADSRYAVFELGMNHPGELAPLSCQVSPEVAIVTTVEAVHIGHFASIEAVADAKAEVFAGLQRGGVAVLNRDNAQFDRLAAAARAAGAGRIASFGAAEGVDARLLAYATSGQGCRVAARIDGREIAYEIGAPGRHWALNSLAVLLAAGALGADPAACAAALAQVRPPAGRGARNRVDLPDGGGFELIDESYNASPAAVRAALAVLAGTPVGDGGRRILVLGDMLELGREGERLHRDLAADVEAAGIDLVFTCGPLGGLLFAALPTARRGAHAADAATLLPLVAAEVGAGDVVTVKGSLGMRMAPIVGALARLGRPARPAGG